MKKIKILLTILLLFIVTGCSNESILKENYKKMQISNDGISGYILDLRIYGEYNNKVINESVRITNYKDKELKIVKIGKDSTAKTMYVIDDKQYRTDDNGAYEVDDITKYTNPSVYLEGLLKAYDINSPTKQKIGNENYSLYKVTIKKPIFKQILKDTTIDDFPVNFDVNGKVYIDKDGYVNRIIYSLYGVTIDATYYSINDVKEIHMSYSNSHEKS